MHKIFTSLLLFALISIVVICINFNKKTVVGKTTSVNTKSVAPNYSIVFQNDKVNTEAIDFLNKHVIDRNIAVQKFLNKNR